MAGDSEPEPPCLDPVDRRKECDDVVLDFEGGKGDDVVLDVEGGKGVDVESKVGAKVDLAENEEAVVIDVKHGGVDTEKECRICHLGSDCNLKEGAEVIHLGCACKNELGTAHRHCAEEWFKLRGGRHCEICGVFARNVNAICTENYTLMEGSWSDSRISIIIEDGGNSERRHCCNGLCNLLLACVVMAFILPWFFRYEF